MFLSFSTSRNNRRRNESGFTLIELLVVIAIIGVLAAIVMVSLSDARQKADDSKRAQDMAQIKNAIELYASKHNGSYPALSAVSSEKYFADADGTNGAEGANKASGSFIQNMLAYITAPTYAAGSHSDTACHAFDLLANALVADSDLSSAPSDPHDADTVTCYKAWSDGDTLAVWTYLWQKYQNTSSGSSQPANKQVGFLVSKHAEIDRTKVAEVCTATRTLYGVSYAFPVINPYSSSTLCDGSRQDGLIADAVLGVTAGSETLITESGSSGSCSDPTYTDSTSCTEHGTCSNTSYSTQSSCTSSGECSNGSTDISESTCYALSGTCSYGGYSDPTTCVSYGYCSIGSYTDEASCTSYSSSGSCSSGGYTDEGSCTSVGSCSNSATNISQSVCTSYGTCYDSGGCTGAGAYSNQADCESNGCSWSSNGYIWTANAWTNGSGYSWTASTWTPSYSWSAYSWTPNTWTP